ncbi:hypothetical protein RhiirA1_386596 [Rhizophagus irregularis]|uniref:Uncharacterized protein n=1 Tax=Rhizophagus irregularis TaxID=588596 RepID=A0A2I1DSY3_9GLOM|nr:hypothetical protein RhiirA1_386596 [Rhizophagus irregularis]PKY13002.1 hypothetical protein RhiirB3_378927 [Rhizophagus irregularis]
MWFEVRSDNTSRKRGQVLRRKTEASLFLVSKFGGNSSQRISNLAGGRVGYIIKKKLDDLLEEKPKPRAGILSKRYFLYEQGISPTEDALKDDTELLKNVKRVLEVIVGLLKDRRRARD